MSEPVSRKQVEMPLNDNPDAMAWANEFMRLFGERKAEIDHGLMLAWFANAIMAGHDWVARNQWAKTAALEQERDEARTERNTATIGKRILQDKLTTLTAERDRLKEALALCDPQGERMIIHAPEDPQVRELCEQVGYGAVMDSAARQWREKDPIGAFTVGPCVATVQAALRGEGG